nr:unnamed protein product [Callosobruchus chinensis]
MWRVAPLKEATIPRLELCAALLLSRLLNKVLESWDISVDNIFLWSDSTIVLSWIQSDPANCKVFVAHRVHEIETLNKKSYWHYVNTTENPADLISRGSGWELRKNDVLRLDCVYWIDKLLKVSAGRRSTQQCLNQLFITTRGKTAGASASTIRGWIRTAFQTIGIGNPPGSTRSAVASYNCSVYKLSVEEVLARGNWKSSSTFIKHYFKDIDMTQRPQTNGILIKEDGLSPFKWTYGKVVALHPGTDNAVRVVSINTVGGKYKRPVSKLCLLPGQKIFIEASKT